MVRVSSIESESKLPWVKEPVMHGVVAFVGVVGLLAQFAVTVLLTKS